MGMFPAAMAYVKLPRPSVSGAKSKAGHAVGWRFKRTVCERERPFVDD